MLVVFVPLSLAPPLALEAFTPSQCSPPAIHKQTNKTNKTKQNKQNKQIKGLVYLHSQQIIHRDLKSQNILLWDRIDNADIAAGQTHPMPERLSAKICDFGLARQIDHATHMTGTPGTPAWMAPGVCV